MSLSVEENVLRCIKKFGARVTSSAALRQSKWKSTYRPPPRDTLAKAESADPSKDK